MLCRGLRALSTIKSRVRPVVIVVAPLGVNFLRPRPTVTHFTLPPAGGGGYRPSKPSP